MIRLSTNDDSDRIKNFCHAQNKRLPQEPGFNLLCENNGEIIGFVHVGVKTFVDPMVVNESVGIIERVRAIREMMTAVRGLCIGQGVQDVYFTAEGENFISFLEREFQAEKYTNEIMYRAKV